MFDSCVLTLSVQSFFSLSSLVLYPDPQPLLIFRTAVIECLLRQVIPRKDLPRIYTMCLPVNDRDRGFYAKDDVGEGDLSLSSGLQDLEVSACYHVARQTLR